MHIFVAPGTWLKRAEEDDRGRTFMFLSAHFHTAQFMFLSAHFYTAQFNYGVRLAVPFDELNFG